MLSDRDTWKSIVIDGALHDRGMVSFKAVLDEPAAEAARAYVIAEANWAKEHDATIMGAR